METVALRSVGSSGPVPASKPRRRWPEPGPRTDRGKKVGLRARATPGPTYSVDVSPSSATIEVGDTLQLQAAVVDEYGNLVEDQLVQWASADESVAAASDSGTVMTMAEGSTKSVETKAPRIASDTKNPKLESVCHAEATRAKNPSESATEVVTTATPACRNAASID